MEMQPTIATMLPPIDQNALLAALRATGSDDQYLAPNGGGSDAGRSLRLEEYSREELLARVASLEREKLAATGTAVNQQHQHFTFTQQHAVSTSTSSSSITAPTQRLPTDGSSHSPHQIFGYENHPLYSKLTTPGARKAFANLWERTKKYGCDDELPNLPLLLKDPRSNKVQPPVNDPDFFRRKCPEEKYSKPDGFVALNRSFFPTDIGKDAKHRICAIRNCPQSADEEAIDDQVDLQKQLHKAITEIISSKCKLLLFEKADELQIKHGGKVTRKFDEIRKEFHQNPTRVLLEQLYNLIYRPREDGHSFNEILYTACQTLKVYCPVSDKEKDFTNKGCATVPKAHALSKCLHNKFREICRNSILGKPAHGITITISNKGRTGRRKKGFLFEDNVKGWDEVLHQHWKHDSNVVNFGGTGIIHTTKLFMAQGSGTNSTVSDISHDLDLMGSRTTTDSPPGTTVSDISHDLHLMGSRTTTDSPPGTTGTSLMEDDDDDDDDDDDASTNDMNQEISPPVTNVASGRNEETSQMDDDDASTDSRSEDAPEETPEQYLDRKWQEEGGNDMNFFKFQTYMLEKYGKHVLPSYGVHISWRTECLQQLGKENLDQYLNRKRCNNRLVMHNLGLGFQKEPASKKQKKSATTHSTAEEVSETEGPSMEVVTDSNTDSSSTKPLGPVPPQPSVQPCAASAEKTDLLNQLKAAKANNKHYEKRLRCLEEDASKAGPSAAITGSAKMINRMTLPKITAKPKKNKKKDSDKRLAKAAAPDDEYEAMEVLNCRLMGSRLQFHLEFTSHSGKYEDYSEWSDVDTALMDCMDDTDENIVIVYALNIEDDAAKREKVLLQIKKEVQRNKELDRKYPSSYYTESADNSPQTTTETDKSCDCGHSHDLPFDSSLFEPITWPCYFLEGHAKGFLSGTTCCKCKIPIETEGVKKPSEGIPVYVCRTLMKTKGQNPCTNQDSVWCNACARKTEEEAPRASRKRSARA